MEKKFIGKPEFHAIGRYGLIGAWVLILGLGVIVRLHLFNDFPFPFAHPDTGQYLNVVVSMLNGGSFVPGVIRVNFTYAFFIFLVLKFLGSGSFSAILLQTTLSVLSAALGSFLVFRITRSLMLTNLCLLVLLFLPRGLVYEHILLGESVFAVLIISFLATGFVFVEYQLWRSLAIILLGLMTSLLLLSRGQALITVVIGLGFIAALFIEKRIHWKDSIRFAAFFLVPVFVLTSLYRMGNAQENDFHGLSAAGNYNLFWIATSRYFDFESPKHADVKNSLKPYVIATNQGYSGSESWGVEGVDSRGNLFPNVDVSQMTWTEINQLLGEVAREAIVTHPLAFAYRTSWNMWDFLWGKTSLFETIDIRDLLLQGDAKHFRIDAAKAWRNRVFNPLENYTQKDFGIGRLLQAFPVIDYTQVAVPELPTDTTLQKLHPLANFRWMTLGVWFLLVVAWCNRSRYRLFLCATSLLVIGQIFLTILPANALYDRYFVGVEPVIVLGVLCAVGTYMKLSRYDQVKTAVLIGIIPGLSVVFYLLFSSLPLPYPMFDRPILGLADSTVIQHQRVAIGLMASLIATPLCFIPGKKISRYLRQRYERSD